MKLARTLSRLRRAALTAAVLAGAAGAAAQSYVTVNAFPNLTFQDPVYLTFAPGTNRLYVAGREGQIWSFLNDPATSTKTLVLDLTAVTQGYNDSGLLGFAFHPQFGQAGSPNRGYLYVYYCYTPGPIVGSQNQPPNNTTPCYDRLSRFTIPDGASVADPASEVVLINQYDRDLWHNGGAMFFGPDGFLYLTNGDEGGVNDQYHQTQKINDGLFSGVLRIDVDQNPAKSHAIRRQPQSGAPPPAGWPASYTANYFIPNDNPWQDPAGGVLEEFWAHGLRSPHRMSYDAPSGVMWLTDVGQNLWEEVDLLQKGANYQWSYLEGNAPGPLPKPATLIGTDTPPLYVYSHNEGNGCVIGGYVYHGTRFASALAGKYIFGDYNSNRIWSMTSAGSGPPVVTQLAMLPASVSPLGFGGLTSFGLDQNGEIYLCTLGPAGQIWTLATPGQILNLSARDTVGVGQSLTAGFVVAGTGGKPILARGVGPGLTGFGVSPVLPDPSLKLYNSSDVSLAQNDNWSDAANAAAAAAAATRLQAFPLAAGSKDAALLTSVSPGAYTVQITGTGGTAGNAMAEVYDASLPTDVNPPQMVNFSVMAPVGPGTAPLIAGFVISGGSKAVLLRAVGPTLAQFGVAGALSAPVLQIFNSAGAVVAQNSGWSTGASTAQTYQMSTVQQTTGAFALPSGSADAALLLTLPPGAYTAQVSGLNASGLALFEIYGYP